MKNAAKTLSKVTHYFAVVFAIITIILAVLTVGSTVLAFCSAGKGTFGTFNETISLGISGIGFSILFIVDFIFDLIINDTTKYVEEHIDNEEDISFLRKKAIYQIVFGCFALFMGIVSGIILLIYVNEVKEKQTQKVEEVVTTIKEDIIVNEEPQKVEEEVKKTAPKRKAPAKKKTSSKKENKEKED